MSGLASSWPQAFTRAWLAHLDTQNEEAAEAARRFLDRHEYMSLWETQEVHDELNDMWQTDDRPDAKC